MLNDTLADILNYAGKGARTEGTFTGTVEAIATLGEARAGDLSFLGNAKYASQVATCQASIVLLPPSYTATQPAENQVFVYTENPSALLANICKAVERQRWPKPAAGIHPSAVVMEDAEIDAEAYIGPLCVIEAGARIGAHCIIEARAHIGAHATIAQHTHVHSGAYLGSYTTVGEHCTINQNATIGSAGFGYEWSGQAHEPVPQVGSVTLEAFVDIGANSTIDRARFGTTRIGHGTKVDNLVQIAHNVNIGKHCLLVSQSGVSGSTMLEDGVILGGQAGLAGHLTIGARAMVGAQSGINRNIEAGQTVRGTPAYPIFQTNKVEILQRKLPELFARVKALEAHMG